MHHLNSDAIVVRLKCEQFGENGTSTRAGCIDHHSWLDLIPIYDQDDIAIRRPATPPTDDLDV